uniref:Uncharacterized protein n=1 Tax=Oryza meridionalis TaxID=40149 RepID=A0A0E0E8X9_9ORYZ
MGTDPVSLLHCRLPLQCLVPSTSAAISSTDAANHSEFSAAATKGTRRQRRIHFCSSPLEAGMRNDDLIDLSYLMHALVVTLPPGSAPKLWTRILCTPLEQLMRAASGSGGGRWRHWADPARHGWWRDVERHLHHRAAAGATSVDPIRHGCRRGGDGRQCVGGDEAVHPAADLCPTAWI